MPVGDVTGFRGTTVLPVKWTVVENEHGDRYIEGIAYNAAIDGERRRITCPDNVWNNPDEDVFYSHEAVRWTTRELKAMKLYGTRMCFMHKNRLPSVGKIVDNHVDKDGNLRIIARLYADTKYGKKAIEFLDSGACQELSVGYGLTRNDWTKEVSRGAIDEVSLVPEAHFRGCKVNVKAGRKGQPEERRVAPYTFFRAVRAGSGLTEQPDLDSDDDSDLEEETSSQGFTMSDAATAPPPTNNVPMTPGQLAAQIPKDFGMAGVPPALSETVEAMRRIMMQQSEELAKMQAKTKSFEEQEKKRKAIEEEEAKKYAEQREPIAKDVLAEFEKAVAEEGLAPLSEGWKKLAHQMLTDNSPFSMEQQAATVACMRKINKQDKELAAIKARNLELETAAEELYKMTAVEETERTERRDLKAGRRNAGAAQSIMQNDTEEDSSRPLERRPGWLQAMVAHTAPAHRPSRLGAEFMTAPPSQARNVNAGRAPARGNNNNNDTTTEDRRSAPSSAAAVPASRPPPAQQARTVTAGRTAPAHQQQAFPRQNLPSLGPGNRMDLLNPDFYAFMQEARNQAPIKGGYMFHMAGPTVAPTQLRWGDN